MRLFLAALLPLALQLARAQTWTGGGANNSWSTASNWNLGTAPANNGTANVIFAGSARLAPSAGSAWDINSLSFNSGASSFSVGGSALTIRSGGIENRSANAQTIGNNIVLGGSQTWDADAGHLVFNGAIDRSYHSLTLDGSYNITLNGALSGGWTEMVKNGSGTLFLKGANTFQGPMTINNGVVNLQHSSAMGGSNYGNKVAGGASLELQGGISVAEGGVEINGTGAGGQGALRNVSGNNFLNTQLNVKTASYIQSSGGTLNLSGALSLEQNATIGGAGNVVVESQIYGSGEVIKTGSGTLTYSGSSAISHGGVTRVEGGVLVLNRTAGINAFNNGIIVGTGSSSALLQLGANDQIADHLGVTVNANGEFRLNGKNETIASLTLAGGKVTTGAGTLTLGNSSGAVTASTSSTTASIEGNLQLSASAHNFNVADGSQYVDLRVTANLTGSGNLNKTGAGVMEITGNNNSYNGAITVTGGTLLLGGTDKIKNTTAITLGGGALGTQGFSDTVGVLTMTSSSSIDLGSGSSVLRFASSSSASWSGELTIRNWSGSSSGGGSDQIYFGSASSGLTSGQLAQIRWSNPYGSGDVVGATMLSNGEIVPIRPVPEPATVFMAAALAGAAALRERRRLAGLWGQWRQKLVK